MYKHYYISFNGSDFSEIYPAGSPICDYNQVEGTRIWREELEKIKLLRVNNATVFDTLESYFTDKTKFDTELEIEIYTGLRATGTIYFKGLFSISDSALDPELKTFEIKPRVNDDYFDIFEKYEVQYEVDTGRSILRETRLGYSVPTALASSWTNGSDPGGITGEGSATGFTTLLGTGGSILTAVAQQTMYSEATHILTTIGTGDVIVLEILSKTGSIDFDFDIVDSVAASITDEGRKTLAAPGLLAWTSSLRDTNPSLYMRSDPGTTKMEFSLRVVDYDFSVNPKSSTLMDFLDDFINGALFMNLSLDVVSTFLNNDALPTGAPSTISTFMTANAAGNYVTETTDNDLNNARIGLLSSLASATAARSQKLSFKDITDHLRDILQVYWFVDADGKVRFEHERYFIAWVTDSTPITVPATGEIDKRGLKYEKGQIASIEQFKWPQAGNEDFLGLDIIYNNFETTNNIKTYSISQITTDIKYFIDNIDTASDTGLGLYHCNYLTGITGPVTHIYEIAVTDGVLSASGISNALFSWANLHNNYWTWSRMASDATMNGTAVTMDSSIRFLQQEGVRFHYATAINPYTAMTTTLTGGAPVTIRRDLDTDWIEMTISYDPYKL